MFKKSFVLFALSFLLSQQSFADPENFVDADASNSTSSGAGAAASASAVAEADPTNKLDSELHIQDDLANAAAIVASAKGAGATFAGEAQFLSLKKMAEKYLSSKESCVSRQAKAASVCLESLSPELASTTSSINMLVSTIGAVAVKDACSNFAKAMDLAKAGMSAYTSACGVMRAGCGTSCVASKSGLEGMKVALAALAKDPSPFVCPPDITACKPLGAQFKIRVTDLATQVNQELNGTNMKSVAGKASLCVDKYANLLASGAMGLASIVASLKQGNSCSDASNGSGTTGPDLANLDVKCAIAEYKNTTECICHLNPRQTGCANSLEKTNGGSGYSGMSAGSGSGGAGSSGGGVTLPTGSESTMPEIASKSAGAGGAGAPVGGGSGIGGGGSAGGNSGGAGGEDGHKGLNTNILSGSGGGGGGGWGGGSRSAADAKYRPYLPGGAKDPQRGVAGQGVSNEVTGQGGKSNWEKVRDRYRDNNSTLLNN